MKTVIVKGNIEPPDHEQEIPINILAVDDNEIEIEFLKKHARDFGHNIQEAADGQKALAVLKEKKNKIDIVILDQEMPVMDGLTAIKHMKSDPDLRNIPIVMLTAADKTEDIEKGLNAGVFYYLVKPVKKAVLRSVLAAAGRAARQNRALEHEMERHCISFDLIDSCKFKFSTLAEAESLAVFMANCFPDPRRVLSGLGELLINAVEHGNLGIGYEKKHELVKAGTWRTEVLRLQQSPEHAQKEAIVSVSRKKDGIYIVIEDQGEGFDWKKFMAIDLSRAGDSHGRGIAQAKATSFDKLIYNEKGNKAVAFIGYKKNLEW